MSLMTARFAAMELLPKLRQTMVATPSSWAANLDDEAHVRRHGQALVFLADGYSQALGSLPRAELGQARAEQLSKLLESLKARCEEGLEQAKMLLGTHSAEAFTSTPKYYYSELRLRRKCLLPPQDKVFLERRVFSFLATEAVACLRAQERLLLLAKKLGLKVAREHWESCAAQAGESATDIIAVMMVTFSEAEVARELQDCLKDEQMVCDELLDGSKGRVRFGNSASFASMPSLDFAEDDLEEEDDDDDGAYCEADGKPVFVVSDCTGESAERTVRCALGQFGHCFERQCPADITTFRFATSGMMQDIVRKAQERGAFIVYTLVDPVANARLAACCEKEGVTCHDLWSPLLEKLEGYFDASRLGVPGRRQYADDSYMKLIDCIEYTRMLDDGVQPNKWGEADLMILGPSRSGKTPLSFFMAQRGYKVANYPLVPDETLPQELWTFPPERVFALTIEAKKLAGIRSTRMKTLKMSSNSAYAQVGLIEEELNWCKKLYRQNPKWNVIDTTDSGIEENCATILQRLDKLGVVSMVGNVDNPSTI